MMIRKPWLKILLIVLWCLLGGVAMAQPSLTQHPVYLVHPGSVEETPKEYCLIEQKSGAGQSRYYMDVESVICGSKVCKVVTVRLFWDELGRYTHFDMPAGMALEKEEGVAFTGADYDKLQQILANPFSPLQKVYKEDLVDPSSDYNAIDALSGATVTIDQTAIVKGAVWTCYTLWHWAHGPVVAYIRDHTGRAYAVEELLVLLAERDSLYQVLALEQLTKRNAYGDSEINAVEQIALKTESLFSGSLCYFEKAPLVVYERAIPWLFHRSPTAYRMRYLKSIQNRPETVSSGFYQDIVAAWKSKAPYPEVVLLLDILKAKSIDSPEVYQSLLALLEDDLMVSRAVYWFLVDKPLTPDQQLKLKMFQKKHAEALN